MESPATILKNLNLKCTPSRIRLLSFFIDNVRPVDFPELKKLLGKSYHKTSLYRTLHKLYESKCLLRFTDMDGTKRYMYNTSLNTAEQHQHLFYCRKCKQTTPIPVLPKAYYIALGEKNMESVLLVIEGSCEHCK